MKKTFLLLTTAIILLTTSCSDEQDLSIKDELSIINENIIYELPENAVSLEDLIKEYQKDLGIKSNTEVLNNRTLGGLDIGDSTQFTGLKMVFVLYPEGWDNEARLHFFQSVSANFLGGIYTVTDSCSRVDTWYIPQQTNYADFAKLGKAPKKNSGKNLIVASTTTVKTNTNTTEDDDEPKSEGLYTSCHQVPLDLVD